jgi:hypothetical protein
MKKTRIIGITVLIVAGGLALRVARAQQPGIKRTDRATAPTAGSTHGASLGETVTVAADEANPNLPGKRLVTHIVDYPPRGEFGLAPSRPLGFHLRLRPLGRDPEPGR